jgi:rod shape-determining protein MreD
MKDFLRGSISLIFVILIQAVLIRMTHDTLLILNPLSILVIYFAIERGERFGAVYGMLCGLIQDSFSMGVFGVAGIAKTLVGFFAGSMSRKIDIIPFRRNFLFLFFLLAGELVIWILLYALIYGEPIHTGNGLIVFQPLVTAILGSVIIVLLKKKRRALEESS